MCQKNIPDFESINNNGEEIHPACAGEKPKWDFDKKCS
jgi:hypothetical protein